MCKKALQDRKMDGDVLVDEAATWARDLTRREARGPGDMENAWRRLEARYGVPWRTFWSLRYRKPREIGASIYQRLAAAYEAERERQMRLLRHDIETTKKIAGADCAAVREAEALVGEVDEP